MRRPRSAKPAKVSDWRQLRFAEWETRAIATLERERGVKAGTIPTKVWREAYVLGLSPEEASERAAVSAYNKQSHADRLRRR